MSKSVKIGLAGAGVFGSYHAAKFASHATAELAAVYDPDPMRTSALAERHGARAMDDYDNFLQIVDAVAITAPATCHFDLARKALSAGRHVFVEKPITLNTDEATALIALAVERGLILQVGHQERYVFDAVGLLRQDRAPLKIDCVRNGPSSGRCEDVSVVFDLMIHDIDLVRELTKSEIRHIKAEGDVNQISAELMLENDAVVSLTASRCADARERRMTLVYEDGVVEFDFVKRTLSNSTPSQLNEAFVPEGAPLALRDPLGFGAELFIEAVQEGVRPVVCGKAGRDAVTWAERIEGAAGLSVAGEETAERLRA